VQQGVGVHVAEAEGHGQRDAVEVGQDAVDQFMAPDVMAMNEVTIQFTLGHFQIWIVIPDLIRNPSALWIPAFAGLT
jgi:hypothetical protein